MNALSDLLSTIKKLFVWWVAVMPWEEGIRIRFGNRVRRLKPGFHLAIPFVDRAFVQNTRLRTIDAGMQTLSTRDGRNLIVAATVRLRVDDVEKLFFNMSFPTDTIADILAAAISEFVVVTESAAVNPKSIAEAVGKTLDLEPYGFGEAQVVVTDFAFIKAHRLVTDQRVWRGHYIDTYTAVNQDAGSRPA